MAEIAEAVGHDGALQVVMLRIGAETFALDAGMVREIIDPIPATRVAGARGHLASVVNVRGNVVPLADIRERFGMPPVAATRDTRFVVIEVAIEGDPVVVALIADKVFEVTEIHFDQRQAIPKIGTNWRPEYIKTIVKFGDDFVIIPDIERILN
ncbi:chemotaxis protein CheW [Methylobacterium sp. J-068]|uniref:chemotaxis protein CheW n=1 Tax=Methylobacterium sp. J-068 TaxID=2836649 RepID=UPI001FBB6555|nr:chemotaxis protein CheW [Methylobacterium sp. J-068]MCJ2036209.1 chemotaxis protein CheW [Methylobacterium sp. J-068]